MGNYKTLIAELRFLVVSPPERGGIGGAVGTAETSSSVDCLHVILYVQEVVTHFV